MHNRNTLRKIPGKKIRRQYFNIPIYLILSIDAALLSSWTAITIQNPVINDRWEFPLFLLTVSMVLLLPLVMLSVLNRFCFGKVICVLDGKGLHYESGFVEWKQITKAVYEPDLPGSVGHRIFCCNLLCLTVRCFQKEKQIELDHAPFLLLRKVKKHCPGIPCKLAPIGVVLILSLSLGLSIVSFLCALAE